MWSMEPAQRGPTLSGFLIWQAVRSTLGAHPRLEAPRSSPRGFRVIHYAHPVLYDCTGGATSRGARVLWPVFRSCGPLWRFFRPPCSPFCGVSGLHVAHVAGFPVVLQPTLSVSDLRVL